MIRIRLEEAQLAPRRLQLRALPATIGRTSDNVVVVDRPHVSSHHGEILLIDGRPAYIDLGSTNGSSLIRNGNVQRVDVGRRNTLLLEPGDRILLGDPSAAISIVVESVDLAAEPEHEHVATVVVSERAVSSVDVVLARCRAPEALAALCRFSRVSMSLMEELSILRHFTATAFELFPTASHVSFFLSPNSSDGTVKEPRSLVYSRGLPEPAMGAPPGLLATRVRDTGRAVLVDDADQATPDAGTLRASGIRSMLASPLYDASVKPSEGDVVQVENRVSPRGFSDEDLDRLLLLASQASIVLSRARRENALREDASRLLETNRALQEKLLQDGSAQNLVAGPGLRALLGQLTHVLTSDATVLITGETGVGKEVVAQYIHQNGRRSDRPFLAVNCAALNETLLEDELFGHVRGAFTGATNARRGMFELADGGTLLLDELGDMAPSLQAKLLRVLERGEIWRLGGEQARKVDVRILAATNRDLREDVHAGRFRADLYYRLAVYPLHIPPLRKRQEDILPLARHFLGKLAERYLCREVPTLSKEVEAMLLGHAWPGNARELKNEIERAFLRSGMRGSIDAVHLGGLAPISSEMDAGNGSSATIQIPAAGIPFEELERQIYQEVLRMHDGHQSKAAKALDLKYTTFRFRAKRVGAL